ncbi:methyltransferase domain-containing protein [Caballeronia sp. SEWSISQ10-4 2]|uniref:class I SAM-dependent methyltransferase n=1 Tax=Caballeronia sp. SEWSISQ10-4 2 TaxID=2937438 RepID=UPI002655FBCF|nr:methyltransferase domain-containing protein [Caballeronia sp. SEWSISQ10-4 2]MDN7181205.1 methyltransferase domain-containing protein [Caballeronia sp. SEWSISQ10-4 2]
MIKSRQSVYLPLVEALANRVQKKVLDVGCGRAEWLELLGERGVPAEGLDLNDDFVADGKRAGLNVFSADAMQYLGAQPDQSYGLISAFHVVEHLGFENLLLFLREAYRVVDDGGAILLETPNPANLLVGACNFYLDPTHERPIPSILLSFAAEFSGFEQVVIVPVNRGFLQNNLELMPTELSGASVINRVVSSLDQNFMQAPDYAIIAFKKAGNELVEVANSLVSDSPLPISAKEAEDVNALLERVIEAEAERATLRADATSARVQLHDTLERMDETQVRLGEAHGRLEVLQARLLDAQEAASNSKQMQRAQELEAQLQAAHARAAAAEDLANRSQQHVIALLSSSSWRLSSPIRVVGKAVRKAGGAPGAAKRTARLGLLHAVAYVRCRPALKQRIANLLARFPRVRARLVRYAGFDAVQGVVSGAPLPAVESVGRLTARGRSIYHDLISAKNGDTQ